MPLVEQRRKEVIIIIIIMIIIYQADILLKGGSQDMVRVQYTHIQAYIRIHF